MKKINWKQLVKFIPLIGIALFVYMIVDIGIGNIVNAFVKIPIYFYVLACFLLIPRILFSSYKWWYICKKQKMDFSFYYITKIFLISLFYGNVTPGGIGAHIRILYLRKKSNIPIGKLLANSLIDLSLGLIAGLFLALIGSIIIIKQQPGFFPIILIFLIFNIATFVVLIQKHSGTKLYKFFIKPLIPKKYKTTIDQSVESLYEDIPRLRDSIIPLLVEIIVWFIACTQVFIIAQAFDINIPYLTFVLLSAISIAFIAILPISVGGLGVREGAFVVILSFYGVEPHISFALSFTGFLVKMICPTALGFILSLKKENRLT